MNGRITGLILLFVGLIFVGLGGTMSNSYAAVFYIVDFLMIFLGLGMYLKNRKTSSDGQMIDLIVATASNKNGLKQKKVFIPCKCGQLIEYTQKLTRCPKCSTIYQKNLVKSNLMSSLLDTSSENPTQIEYDSKKLTKWLYALLEKKNIDWEAAETRDKILFAIKSANNEIKLLGFQTIKLMPVRIQLFPGYRWKIVKELENQSEIFRKITLEIIQQWPKTQKEHRSTQEVIIRLQTDENHEIGRLARSLIRKTEERVSSEKIR